MAFNFPASPGVGDEYTASGVTYTWTGTVWLIKVPVGLGEPPNDGQAYGRKNGPGTTPGAWVSVATLAQMLAAASPVGQIINYAGSSPPPNFLKADGSIVSRTTYAALFAVCQTVYGAGDGSTTFQLPDLRGEFIRGWDDGRGIDAGRTRGSSQDHSTQTHTHTFNGVAVAAHTHTATSDATAMSAGTPAGSVAAASAGTPAGSISSDAHTHTGTTSSSGAHTHALTDPVATTNGTGNAGLAAGATVRLVAISTESAGAHTHTFTTSSDTHNHTFTGSAMGTHAHTFTGSAMAAHDHAIATTVAAGGAFTPAGTNAAFGSAETRPRNVALLVCIKYQ